MTNRTFDNRATAAIGRRSFLGGAAAALALAATAQLASPLLGLAGPARASNAPQRIADHFSSVRTMMGEFVQFGPRGEQTGGKFFIERPGKVRFNYDPPAAFRVISDGQTVVLENTKMKTADVYPLSRTPLKLLLDSRIDLSGNKVRQVVEEADLTTIQLADKSVFGDSTITMMFDPSSYELRQWTITDAQGKDTTVMIYNVEQGVTFDPSVFAIDARAIHNANQAQRNRNR
jgi:outer membrane lipoprotein-sorting protein